jgi:NAD(P)-dependent dehydrogenase (short-subunit alcohol dehydrogenase family)
MTTRDRPGRLAGKTALVTGGSNGIGAAIARAFAREGCDVVFTYRNDLAAARSLVDEIRVAGGIATAVAADLSQRTAAFELSAHVLAQRPRIDILVNNVGILTRTAFLRIEPAEYDRVVDTSLRAPFFLAQAIARHMVAQRIAGSIINVSSLSAQRAVSRVAHYQVAKAGVSMLTRSLAVELGEHGIRVNTLAPGLTATAANRVQWETQPAVWAQRGERIPLGRAGVPSDHAAAAVFLASDESAWTTGAEIVIDGGLGSV